MTKYELYFDEWFCCLRTTPVTEKSGIAFHDAESVRDDYESGKSYVDVAHDIIAEYND